jgi:hypothetical protein
MGNSIVVEIVVKYVVNIMCPLLLQVYNHLNHTKEQTKPIKVEEDDILFWYIESIDNVISSTLKVPIILIIYLCNQQITRTPYFDGHNMRCNS